MLDATIGRLVKQHEPTARAVERLLEQRPLAELERDQLLTVVEQLLASGWHGWEAAGAFLEAVRQSADHFGNEQMIAWGAASAQLGAVSFEPVRAFWELPLQLTEGASASRVDRVLSLACATQSAFNYASQLLVRVIGASSVRAIDASGPAFDAWLNLMLLAVQNNRDLLERLLDHDGPETLWERIDGLGDHRAQAKISMLDWMLRHRFEANQLDEEWFASLHHLLTLGENLDGVLAGLSRLPLEPAAQNTLKALIGNAESMLAAELVLQHADRLPLLDEKLCLAWFAHGHSLALEGEERSVAYFSLESAESVDFLESLQGLVRLDDKRRVFGLFAEAMSGETWQLHSTGEQWGAQKRSGDSSKTEVENDSRTVLLPEWIALAEDHASNERIYLHTILQRVGWQQFGFERSLNEVESLLASFADRQLALDLLILIEGHRVDWCWQHKLDGVRGWMPNTLMQMAQQVRARDSALLSALELALLLSGHDQVRLEQLESAKGEIDRTVSEILRPLSSAETTWMDSVAVLRQLYPLVESERAQGLTEWLREVPRTKVAADELGSLVPIFDEETPDQASASEQGIESSLPVDASQLDVESMSEHDLPGGEGQFMTELDETPEIIEKGETESAAESALVGKVKAAKAHRIREQYYDEWDYKIMDYRRRWCRLVEILDPDEDLNFYESSIRDHAKLQAAVRAQLSRLKPELLVKRTGMIDGEWLDLERAIDAVIDRKLGQTPSEQIYIQSQRRGRDVATLFLLDMSASTDDRIDAEPQGDAPEYHDFDWDDDYVFVEPEGDRIIDLEKHAVIQMCEALEALGDAYAVAGFSGYGRDQVEYFQCKSFSEPLNAQSRARIGGIKACRSTRMGPAIRHAAQKLQETDSRIKALIMISDGYPQDHDYGNDRNDKAYGIHDTTKALVEAKKLGIQSFCLTVDPSGHDYLRQMCPDRQYMVIQDVTQLPSELSKVYRSLTG